MWSCSFAACLIRRLLPCEEDIAQAHLGFTSKLKELRHRSKLIDQPKENMNEDDKPRCSKQQDEGEHTRQPHNYCSQTNPLLTQENELHAISKTRSSLIVSSSQLPFLYNTIYKSLEEESDLSGVLKLTQPMGILKQANQMLGSSVAPSQHRNATMYIIPTQ
ncbi:uncharacterized protein LOC123349360 isoform X3 [Mauremys mutica]|uniref:uncharacterized protein LOC123349360 isoform X3 n=1 Tax=Mauremys mutica TaxID=74926 RepID=UPI001D16290C|nr:uncharacterized protein LOC123349360 isoform X3 [Mauremys mutica]